MEKGMLSYNEKPEKAKDMPSPKTPFPPTFINQHNTLKLAFHAQSVGYRLGKNIKDRVVGECTSFTRRHYSNIN
jgi:hypothetical protein